MEYQPKTYFAEHEEQNIKGFTIVDTGDEVYHIAEKWLREGREDTWLQYEIPAEQLEGRVEEGACEPKAELTDEQYEQVCEHFSEMDIGMVSA